MIDRDHGRFLERRRRHTYRGYTIEQPLAQPELLAQAVTHQAARHIRISKLGIETQALPAQLWWRLKAGTHTHLSE